MDPVKWLEKNSFLRYAFLIKKVMKHVIINTFGLKPGERLSIITDCGLQNRTIAPILAGGFYLAAKELRLDASLVVQKPKIKGAKADERVEAAFEKLEKNSVILACLTGWLGSMQNIKGGLRKYLKNKKCRFAVTTKLGMLQNSKLRSVVDSLNANYSLLRRQCAFLKKAIAKSKEIIVKTANGTELYFRPKKNAVVANDGNYKAPGSGGNLPAGEVYCPPLSRKVDGVVIIDGSMTLRDRTILPRNPVKLLIENGTIIDIKGKKEASLLKETIRFYVAKKCWEVKRICELGIGLNSKAKVIGSTIIDEKAWKTAHVALGSNYWFGGSIYTNVHLDQVFRNPKIYIDNRALRFKQ